MVKLAALRAEYSMAEEFYNKALKHDVANISAHIGVADLLYHIRHDYETVLRSAIVVLLRI